MKIPQIMILDREPDDVSTVLNISHDENTLIIHALEDVTVAFLDGNFPCGTLKFKAGQVIMIPTILLEES